MPRTEPRIPVRRHSLRSLLLVPAAILPLLPSVTCPACLAAYTGVLSAVGLGFLVDERVLAPLIAGSLVVGVASIAWSTRTHRRPGPIAATVVGSAAVVAGRLVWSVPVVLYGGVALLIGASLWNLRLKRPRGEPLVQLRLERRGEPT
jgi:mercuric ion transport protein